MHNSFQSCLTSTRDITSDIFNIRADAQQVICFISSYYQIVYTESLDITHKTCPCTKTLMPTPYSCALSPPPRLFVQNEAK